MTKFEGARLRGKVSETVQYQAEPGNGGVRRPRRQTLPHFTDRLPLGDQGLLVSPFCLGMVRSPEAVSAAFDAGINFFFLSADMHWPLYEPLRCGLKDLLRRGGGIRDEIVLGAACYPTQPDFCTYPFQEVLDAAPEFKRLDLLIAGGVYSRDFPERLPVYQQHRRGNFLGSRAIGMSFHDRQTALTAISQRLVDIAYIRYNPSHPGARDDLFPYVDCSIRSLLFNFKSTLGYVSPDLQAELGLPGDIYWQPAITDYYRFALTRPEFDGLLVAPGTSNEVAALAAALELGPLEPDEDQFLRDLALVASGGARVAAEQPAIDSGK